MQWQVSLPSSESGNTGDIFEACNSIVRQVHNKVMIKLYVSEKSRPYNLSIKFLFMHSIWSQHLRTDRHTNSSHPAKPALCTTFCEAWTSCMSTYVAIRVGLLVTNIDNVNLQQIVLTWTYKITVS